MRILDRVSLAPLHRYRGRLARVLTRFGRHDNNGRFVGDYPILISLDTTFSAPYRRPPIDANPAPYEQMIYGGLIFGWFGHFITESLPNLLAVARAKADYPNAKIIAHAHCAFDPVVWRKRHRAHINYFFGKLGLDPEDLHFVFEPMVVDQLIMPDSPFKKKFHYQEWVLADMDNHWGQAASGQKLYLSRSAIDQTRVVDEHRIEDRLKEAGFDVFHPQTVDLEEQIHRISAADIVAGPQGSALHWSLYSARCRRVLSLGFRSHLQKGICKSRGQSYCELSGMRPRGGAFRLRDFSDASLQSALEWIDA